MFRRMPLNQAVIHASWHAILFFVYMLAIYLLFPLFSEFIGTLADFCDVLVDGLRSVLRFFNFTLLIPYLEVDIHDVEQTFRLTFSAGVIGFVWLTYSDKINENHTEKTLDADELIKKLRIDLRVFFTAFRRLVGARTLMTNALAATVAVDMLAISAMTKTTLMPAAISEDKAVVDGPETMRSVYLTPSIVLDLLVFALIIFGCVLTLAWLAGKKSQTINEVRASKSNKWLFALRIAEPFLVFFFVAYALDVVFNGVQEFDIHIFALIFTPEHFLYSLVISFTLLWRHGIDTVFKSVCEGNGMEDLTVDADNHKISWSDFICSLTVGILKALWPFVIPTILVGFAFVASHKLDDSSYVQHVNFMTYMGLLLATLPVINALRSSRNPAAESSDLLSDDYNWKQSLQTPLRRLEYRKRYFSMLVAFVATMIFCHVHVLRDWDAQTAEDQSHILIIYTTTFIAFAVFGMLYWIGTRRPEDATKIPDELEGVRVYAPLPQDRIMMLLGFLIAFLPLFLPRATWGVFLTQQ